MNKQKSELEIVDIYYADCYHAGGPKPQWSTARTKKQLTSRIPRAMLKEQLHQLYRREKLEYKFSGERIDVEPPCDADVKSILQDILELPTRPQALGELKQYGDVLAQKYLQTRYSRTRLFMVTRVKLEGNMRLFLLVSDLTPKFSGGCIRPDSLSLASRTIPNLIGELKKGAVYPGISNGQLDKDAILIYEKVKSKYYHRSLECIPKRTQEVEARSLFKVIAGTCTPTKRQLTSALRALRAIRRPSFGSTQLARALKKAGIEVDSERVNREWCNQFDGSHYKIDPTVLALDSVTLTIILDEFEIKCPLIYYLDIDRIKYDEEEGFQYLTARGREYIALKVGSSRIHFASRDNSP